MKGALLFVAAAIAALAFALPATAGTTTFRGVVIAKDAARKSIVTVSRNGSVRTIRTAGKLKKIQIGRIVAVQAAALPDGTFAASKVRPLGRATGARFRATLVSARGATLALSAGGSVFALRVRKGKGKTGSATGTGFHPGDRIQAKALVKRGSLQARREALKLIGHDDQLELEGIYLDTTDAGAIEMAVLHKGRVSINVPDDVVVPDFQAGDEMVAVVKVAADGTFTLVSAENESSDGDDGSGGGVNGDGTFTVTGSITSLSVDRIFVQAEHHDPVSCSVPQDFDTGGFAVGDAVQMTCDYADGNPVLVDLEPAGSDDPPPGDDVVADGPILTLTANGISVDDADGPVTCAVPEGADLSAFHVGDEVDMECAHTDAGLVLTSLDSDDASWGG
ncbi:MAG TPA: hypothetical protein VIW19_03740 [Gaiellaceae bacterium]